MTSPILELGLRDGILNSLEDSTNRSLTAEVAITV